MQYFYKKISLSSFKKKIFFLNITIAFGIIAFLLFFYLSFSKTLEKEKMIQTKSKSESAMGAIKYFYDLSDSGLLESSIAMEYAMNALEAATFGNNGYFWINSGDGYLLMQPYTPERVGINQIDWTDIKGDYIFQKFIKKAKGGGGWVSYYWPKPNKKVSYPKISYVSYFQPWDWVLGTGVYLDDIQNNIFWTVFNASAILFVIFIIFIFLSILLVNYFIRQLNDFSIRDSLTSLYNKGFLAEIIPMVLRKHIRYKKNVLGVIFVDIDHFKNVNDTYGHEYGDIVLRGVASLIINNTRPDDYCIRYGGEEFIIIGLFRDESSAINVVERIREKVSLTEYEVENIKFNVTISSGIAFHKTNEESFDFTLKKADMMLYRSKKEGRNRISF